MSRIKHIELADWEPGLRAAAQADDATQLEQGLLRICAHRSEIAKDLIAFGAALKANHTLPSRLTELVRLRVAFHN